MIWHQAIGLAGDAVALQLLRQEVEIDLPVTVFEEDRFAPVTALGNMMRNTRNDHSCTMRHGSLPQTVQQPASKDNCAIDIVSPIP